MKRYDLMVHEEKDGTVHANMEEDVDGMYVTHQGAKKAIAAAVAAERRRVWDVLNREAQKPYQTDKETTITDLIVKAGWCGGIDHAISILFPYGEPEQTNPPAGERREM